MLHRYLEILLLSCTTAGLALPLATTRACAPVMPRGQSVEIATESALIVWDEKAKKQHFIRRASFRTEVPYFGFLVPTPNQPDLAAVPDEVFARLEDWTRAETKTETVSRTRPLIPIGCAVGSLPAGKAGAGVEVLAQVSDIAGYDAVVLKATDTKALQDWLAMHGYDARPALMSWLEPYLKAGWIITAFQIPKKEHPSPQIAPRRGSSPARMIEERLAQSVSNPLREATPTRRASP